MTNKGGGYSLGPFITRPEEDGTLLTITAISVGESLFSTLPDVAKKRFTYRIYLNPRVAGQFFHLTRSLQYHRRLAVPGFKGLL